MAKSISYELVLGNSLISTQRNKLSKEQVYQYWQIVDDLLPDEYYTIGNRHSFEVFCEEYSFLVKNVDGFIIINCDTKKLERYFRIGVPAKIVSVFDIAGKELNKITSEQLEENIKILKKIVK